MVMNCVIRTPVVLVNLEKELSSSNHFSTGGPVIPNPSAISFFLFCRFRLSFNHWAHFITSTLSAKIFHSIVISTHLVSAKLMNMRPEGIYKIRITILWTRRSPHHTEQHFAADGPTLVKDSSNMLLMDAFYLFGRGIWRNFKPFNLALHRGFMNQLFQILTNGGIVLGIFVILLLNNKGVRKTRANTFLSVLLGALTFSTFHLRFAGDVIHHFSVKEG